MAVGGIRACPLAARTSQDIIREKEVIGGKSSAVGIFYTSGYRPGRRRAPICAHLEKET